MTVPILVGDQRVKSDLINFGLNLIFQCNVVCLVINSSKSGVINICSELSELCSLGDDTKSPPTESIP